MAKKVGELFVELVVDTASGNLSVRQLVGALGELDVASAASVGIMAKLGETLYDMSKAAVDSAVQLTALHDITGADPKIVQQWDKAAAGVVGSAGVIVKAITSVNEIQKRLATGQGAPAALTGLLGLSAYKTDAKGHEVLKDAMDLIKEMAAPGSLYRSRSRAVQEAGLQEIFGGNADNVFRIIQSMTEGRFHPEREPAMNDRQVRELNDVNMKLVHVSQEMTGIFQHFLTSGGAVAGVLDSLADKLRVVDTWLGSKEGQSTIGSLGFGVNELIKRDFNLYAIGKDFGELFGKTYFGPVAAPKLYPSTSVRVDDLRGKLDINLLLDGRHVANKTTYIDRTGKMSDLMDATLTQGNTP